MIAHHGYVWAATTARGYVTIPHSLDHSLDLR
jgi:hypothetical protein